MTDTTMHAVLTALGRTGLLLGVVPAADPETAPALVARKLQTQVDADGGLRMTAPVVCVATTPQELLGVLFTMPDADQTTTLLNNTSRGVRA
jgi:hypothetical protein